MHFYNEPVKNAAKLLSLLYILLGLAFVGYGLWVVIVPWGSLYEDTYLAIGIILALFGSSLASLYYFGFLAAEHQLKRFGKGWSGRSAIALFTVYLLFFLAAVILAYIYGNKFLTETKDRADLLKADPTSNPPYSAVEQSIRDHFNNIYFYVASHCTGRYSWFWTYVKDHCPQNMQRVTCQKCHSYYVTLCSMYEPLCFGTDTGLAQGDNFACPYYSCRQPTLQYVYHRISSVFNYLIYGLAGTTVLHILCNLLLIAHRQTRKMVITVVDIAEGDDNNELIQRVGSQSPGSSARLSHKSEELNYQVYDFSDRVEGSQRGRVVPPASMRDGGFGSSNDVENATIDSYIQMSLRTGEAGGGGHAPLAGGQHNPTSYSTYQLNMEIALAESLQGGARGAGAGAGAGSSSKSEEELARALKASKKQSTR